MSFKEVDHNFRKLYEVVLTDENDWEIFLKFSFC